jgi:hypothetical protein
MGENKNPAAREERRARHSVVTKFIVRLIKTRQAKKCMKMQIFSVHGTLRYRCAISSLFVMARNSWPPRTPAFAGAGSNAPGHDNLEKP